MSFKNDYVNQNLISELKTIYGILFLGCTPMLMSAEKSNIDTAKESKKERSESVQKREDRCFFCFKKLSEQIIEDTYEYSL